MKNPALLLFTVLLLMGCGKSEDKPEVKSSGKDSDTAKESNNDGDTPRPTASNKLPNEHKKPGLISIPKRGSSSRGNKDGSGKEVAEPPNSEEALIGSWMITHDGFNYTIILEKGGRGKMRIAEGERKATHMVTWKADAEKLTLSNKDPKTQDEDVTQGTYKLSDEGGVKLLQLEYDLEEQNFTFIRVKE